ncbi:ATP-binding protein [Candidatus Micrarchaeota archaeon]|nr:ATP-binding protein [Candidatus Micrarchaeota archaeon]
MDSILKFENKAKKWYSKFAWNTNPLDAKTILPELLVGLDKERETLLRYIINGGGYSLVKGPVGSGKTTLCRWLEGELKKSNQYVPIFFEEPPSSQSHVDNKILNALISNGFLGRIQRIFSKQQTEISPMFLENNLKNKSLVIFVDEAHISASKDVLYRIKDIVDMHIRCRLVISGLSSESHDLEALLPDAIINRVPPPHKLSLLNISIENAKDLVMKRISKFGGTSFAPFDEKAIETACTAFNGSPRSFLLFLSYCIEKSIEKELFEVKSNDILAYLNEYNKKEQKPMEVKDVQKQSDVNILADLSSMQMKILNLLSKQPFQSVNDLSIALPANAESVRTQIKRINQKCVKLNLQEAIGSKYDVLKNKHVFWVNDHVARLLAAE